jgi:hypothetical protein
MKLAILCAVVFAGGVVAGLALRPQPGPQRAVEHWLDSMATGDAREFCASTTPGLQAANFQDIGAGPGSCQARAATLLRRVRPYYRAFAGARATRSSGDSAVARVAAADVVLRDGSRMSEWRFGGAPDPDLRIRVVHRNGAWRVDGG